MLPSGVAESAHRKGGPAQLRAGSALDMKGILHGNGESMPIGPRGSMQIRRMAFDRADGVLFNKGRPSRKWIKVTASTATKIKLDHLA
jgi:hypothetical protein